MNAFNYIPVFVNLDESEEKKYKTLSKRIYLNEKRLEEEYSLELEKQINRLKIERSRIVKNANQKYNIYSSLLDQLIIRGNTYDLLSFVTDVQMPIAMEIAKEKKLFVAKITEDESTFVKKGSKRSERDMLIQNFRERKLNMLFGQKCLDEGIDIKNARIAILLASSVNPREFIQRVGRVIRDNPEKEISYIFDFIVLPCEFDEENLQQCETSLIKKEVSRTLQIAVNANNYSEVKKLYKERGIDLDEYQF